ncbi:MAG TPA: EAL domain-containing protein, partial [Gemmatimonadales bacterium]|nr:EAL domain-containing protein [Gemmatimonadales bacterium]
KELREIGVRLSIDDFGTGYSSLAYLRRLPVGELKVDKAFVLGMAGHEDSAIVRTIIELGHNMGLQVVAEGVESAASFDTLRGLRADVVQGFYLSGALPPDELALWVAQRHALVS